MILKRFQEFQIENELHSQKPILLGVSGGRDSVVMCDLFHRSNINFAIAHCNFSLRSEESNQDESFVIALANKYKVDLHKKKFDTTQFAEENGLSIQMAARDLRINWFEEICVEHNYEFYATAHHLDDSIETYFINQIRGTGLSGLHGILPKREKLIHPLLFCKREEITQYAQSNQLDWCEDSSNAKTKYLRNKVRHLLIPLLKEINPQIDSIVQDNMKRLKGAEEIYDSRIQEIQLNISNLNHEGLIINLNRLQTYPQASLVLYELIQEYGFNYSQCSQIIESNEISSGSKIESSSHIILKNREELILKEKEAASDEIWRIEMGSNQLKHPINLNITYKDEFQISKDEKIGQFDVNKLRFPLLLRKWREGDFFYPLGMKGQKKLLSDYFIDEKLSLFDKKQCWLLCSGPDIVWIIGKRIDERFKITKNTNQITEFQWIK